MRDPRAAGRRRRLTTTALSVAGHVGVLLAFVSAQPQHATVAEPPPMVVHLVTPPPPPTRPPAPQIPAEAPAARTQAPPSPKTPAPRRIVARRAPPSPDVAPVPTGLVATTAQGTGELSDGEIAAATAAGLGGGGGGCDMAGRLQAALRRDRLARRAVAEAHRGRPLLVWNGDWVRHGDQQGSGLAAVREAILWEVGFAPPACRAEAVRGVILISLEDAPGGSRLALGTGSWRWGDLVRSRAAR